jgi:hypothetical protein
MQHAALLFSLSLASVVYRLIFDGLTHKHSDYLTSGQSIILISIIN